MPPKKETAAPAPPSTQAGGEADQNIMAEKELVMLGLKSRVDRYQERGEQLLVENVRLADELEANRVNLHDINEFLTNELKARALAGAALEQRVAALERELKACREASEANARRVQADADARVAATAAAMAVVEGDMEASRAFLAQRDSLEARLREAQAQLAAERRAGEKRAADAERALVAERERARKEMAARVAEARDAAQRLTESQLEAVTRRTILENEQMDCELQYQSRQVEKLLARNKAALEESCQLKRAMELAGHTEAQLAKRNLIYQKTIKSLLKKVGAARADGQAATAAMQHVEDAVAAAEDEVRIARRDAAAAREQRDEARAQAEQFRQENEVLHGKHNQALRWLLDFRDTLEGAGEGAALLSGGAPGDVGPHPGAGAGRQGSALITPRAVRDGSLLVTSRTARDGSVVAASRTGRDGSVLGPPRTPGEANSAVGVSPQGSPDGVPPITSCAAQQGLHDRVAPITSFKAAQHVSMLGTSRAAQEGSVLVRSRGAEEGSLCSPRVPLPTLSREAQRALDLLLKKAETLLGSAAGSQSSVSGVVLSSHPSSQTASPRPADPLTDPTTDGLLWPGQSRLPGPPRSPVATAAAACQTQACGLEDAEELASEILGRERLGSVHRLPVISANVRAVAPFIRVAAGGTKIP